MTDQTIITQGSNPLEEHIGNLAEELELAIHWQRPSVLMVTYASEYVRTDFVAMLENFLLDLGQKVIWVHADAPSSDRIDSWKETFDASEDTVFFVDGFNAESVEKKNFRSTLNYYKELIVRKNARVIFYLTRKDAAVIARHAPEFWVARRRLIELVESPKPEQILRSALESTWQGTGEYNDQYEDTEAKISMRESFLTELPRNPESTGIRANLLLTLGVLNWRKGDYEKAEEMLHNALQVATRMHDNWFEAECFNAIALVKSSVGKNDEAIDAYKQAIKLAPEQIFAWNNLGNLCLKIQRNDEAMIAFQKAIEHNAKDPIAWNGLGDVYSRIEYVDDAIAAYRKSIEHGPMFPHPWNGLGEMYARTGRSNEAIAAFQNALKLNQHFVSSWIGLAKVHVKQEHHRDAIRAYQQALSIDPKNSSLWNELGSVFFTASKYQEAVDAFLKAIELDRSSAWAYSNLALAHYTYGKVKDSIALYLKSLDLFIDNKDKAVTWNRLANSYRMMNDYSNAIRAYQQADALNSVLTVTDETASDSPQAEPVIEEEPAPQTESSQPVEGSAADPVDEPAVDVESTPEEDAPFWVIHPTQADDDVALNETITHEIGGISVQMSLPLFSNALSKASVQTDDLFEVNKPKVDSTNARVWNEKGNIHFRASEYEEAVYAYEKAIKLDHTFGWAYCNLGLTYLTQNRYAESILLLQKSIELLANDRDRAVAWNGLGNLYRRLNDYDNAVVAYQKADELDPQNAGIRDDVEHFHSEPNTRNAQVWNELGDLFYKSGTYDEAAKCYGRAIEMEPLNNLSYSNLALCFTHQSRFQEAIPLYLKSIELTHTDTDKAELWNRLGNAYRKLNDYDNAVTAYQNAVKLNNEQMALVTRARFSLLGNCYVD